MRLSLIPMAAALCMAIVSCSLPPDSEAAFERWLRADAEHAEAFRQFEAVLSEAGVADVVPNYQLWRVDRLRPECANASFVAPPEDSWANVIPALQFLRDHVKPAVGELEVASAYRDASFNACVGGASRSAHRSFQALDLVPADGRVGRAELIAALCPIHAREGPRRRVGLGIYQARRFHIDARGYRGWGEDHHAASFPCATAGSLAR
jgi:hypothetical protein